MSKIKVKKSDHYEAVCRSVNFFDVDALEVHKWTMVQIHDLILEREHVLDVIQAKTFGRYYPSLNSVRFEDPSDAVFFTLSYKSKARR